jgi:hypothetical protein
MVGGASIVDGSSMLGGAVKENFDNLLIDKI